MTISPDVKYTETCSGRGERTRPHPTPLQSHGGIGSGKRGGWEGRGWECDGAGRPLSVGSNPSTITGGEPVVTTMARPTAVDRPGPLCTLVEASVSFSKGQGALVPSGRCVVAKLRSESYGAGGTGCGTRRRSPGVSDPFDSGVPGVPTSNLGSRGSVV